MKILKFVVCIVIAALLGAIGGSIVGPIVNVHPVIVGSLFFVGSLIPTPKGIASFMIFSAPGGVATPFSFPLNYLPEHLSWNNSVALTSLKIETTEDGVLHDWTSAGITAMANFEQNGPPAVAGVVNMRLTDGEIRPKNVTLSGVTSAAGVIPFFISSDRIGKKCLKSKNSQVLANNPTRYDKFTALFIPTMATATDRVEITFKSGLKYTYAMEDLKYLSSFFQYQTGIIINNRTSYIDNVVITCAANTPVYVLNVVIPGQVI
jgi:hypothetical protein